MRIDIPQSRSVSCVAIIVAGGQGSRFGSDIPKQLVSLAGYPILHHTLRRFEQAASISQIIVVANQDWIAEIADISSYVLRYTPHQVVGGGASRNESIGHAVGALNELPDDTLILVHDGVRPFVSEDTILRVAKALEHFCAVIPVVPSVDPLVCIDGREVKNFAKRSDVVRGQSPQGFILKDLRRAFTPGQEVGHFDTLFEFLLAGDPELTIGHVEGDLNNIKITSPIDRAIAGQIIMDGA